MGSCQHSNELSHSQNAGNFLIAAELLVHREVPYCMESVVAEIMTIDLF